MLSSVAASPSKAPRAMTRAGGGDFGSVVATTSTIVMPQATPTAMVDTSRYGNAITIASANVAPARSYSGPADNSVPGGGGGIGAPTPAGTQPPSTPSISTPTSPSVVVPSSTGAAPTPSTGIRAMSMAATSPSTASPSSSGIAPAATQPQSGSGIGSASASCSTSAGVVPPPEITASGGGSGATLIDPAVPGAYTMGDVPIGSLITVNVKSQWQIDPATIHWRNGTDITGYLSAAANSTPPASNQIQKGVATNNSTYSFIIDATAKTYTVAVAVSYQVCGPDIQAPESTLTITSVAPTVMFKKAAIGAPQTSLYQDPTTGKPIVQVGLYTGVGVPTGPGTPATAGMTITAQTNTGKFGGQFMFLQMIVPQRYGRDGLNQPFSVQMIGAGPAIDNGFDGKIGYPITNPQSDPINPGKYLDNHSWNLLPIQSYPATMVDSPFVTADSTSNLLQVGNFATGTPESFDTYVMYMPPYAGTWVALGKVHWAWSGKTTDAKNVTQIPNVPGPTPAVPLAGDAAFPGWTDTFTAYMGRGWQPFNGNF